MGIVLKSSPSNEINPWKNKARLGDFFCHNYYIIWQTNDNARAWKHMFIGFGIRRSDKWQLFPIWNMSHNSQKAVLFGFWKLYFEIGYRF